MSQFFACKKFFYLFQFVESLADTVQKSIEEAQQTLEREKEEKFFHDVRIEFFLFIFLAAQLYCIEKC